MTSTQSCLDTLPTEVVDRVVTLLALEDACNLRLVSRLIAYKSSYGIFKTYFTAKTVEWTSPKQLSEFVCRTQPNDIGCLVQHLTIVGMTSTPNQKHPAEKLLEKAFTNLRLNSPDKGLQRLTLLVQGKTKGGAEVVPCERISNWRRIWVIAGRTFEVTLPALAASELPVQELEIFDRVRRCSLACDSITAVLDRKDFGPPLANVKRLSLSVSHRVTNYRRVKDSRKNKPLTSLASGERRAKDISRFLQLCPNLETLELRWHRTLEHPLQKNDAQVEEEQFLVHVAQLEQLSQLRDCRLQGIYTDEATLLTFLRKTTQLRRLSLEHIRLEPPSYTGVFDYLTSHMQHLEYLHLDALAAGDGTCVYGCREPDFSSDSPGDSSSGPSVLTLTGEELQRPIRYYMANPRRVTWGRDNCKNSSNHRAMYGCPDDGYFVRYRGHFFSRIWS